MAVNKVILNGSTIMDVSQDTVTADKLLSAFTATKNNGTKITGNIVGKSASNLTASGSTVTVPAGYYPSQVTKNISSGSVSINGGGKADSISLALTSSTGAINASYHFSSTIGATLTSGYVSSVSNGWIQIDAASTLQLTSLGATSYTPTTTSQTIPSYRWLTGTQTINAIPSAYIIPSGTSTITSNGTYSIGEYASAVVSVPNSEAYRPDAFMVLNAADYSYYSSMITNMRGPSSMYSDGYYVFPSTVTVDDNIITNISSIRALGFTSMQIPSNIVFPYITSIGSQAFQSAQFKSGYYLDFSILFPKMTSLVQSHVFESAKGMFSVNINNSNFLIGSDFLFCSAEIQHFVAPYLEYFGSNSNATATSCQGMFYRTSWLRTVSLNSMTRIVGSDIFYNAGASINGCNYYLPMLSEVSGYNTFRAARINFFCAPNLQTIEGSYTFAECIWSFYSTTLDVFPALSLISAANAFYYTSTISSVYFPNLSCISGNSNFYICSKLVSINMPELEIINGPWTFCSCLSLSFMNLPKLKQIIGASTFYSCRGLTSVTLPMLESISGAATFGSEIYLSFISLPRLSYMSGSSTFWQCNRLISVFFLNSTLLPMAQTIATTFGSTPIYNYSTLAGRWGSVFVPASLLDSYKTATNWTTISSRIFAYEDYFDSNGNPL